MGRWAVISRVTIALAVIGLGLTACVHSKKVAIVTPATVEQATSADVGAVKRGDNLYDVVYIGATMGPVDYMRDMTLYQSAELCLAKGYKYFRASDTQAFSNHAAPNDGVAESPKLTLQVSCLLAENEAAVSYGVDAVISRVKTSYNLK